MYILIDKKTKRVLDSFDGVGMNEENPTENFPQFDAESMAIGYGNFMEPLPSHINVDESNRAIRLSTIEEVELGLRILEPWEKIENNKIVAKTIEEQVKAGLITLSPVEKLDEGQIVQKTVEEQCKEGLLQINEPFCYVENNEIKTRSYDELIAGNYLKTKAQWEEFQTKIYDAMRRDSNAVYSLGEELEIIKDCLDWICEKLGVEEDDDPRCQKYREMQVYLVKVNAQYQPFLAKIDRALSA